MSRYLGPRLRITRRLGDLPGFTNKIAKHKNPPGQHGREKQKSRKPISQYNIRLLEKQRLRFNYGLSESQLFHYVKQATLSKELTGNVLLQFLEMRLDNIVYRLGFTPSIAAARQAINHKHVRLNDKIVTIASVLCKPNDSISFKNKKKQETGIATQDQKFTLVKSPHLIVDPETNKGHIKSYVDRQHVGMRINERLVYEFYSRKI